MLPLKWMLVSNFVILETKNIVEYFSQGYKLDFNYRSLRWQGAVATVVESPESHVWGVVWVKENQTIASLDEYDHLDLLFTHTYKLQKCIN